MSQLKNLESLIEKAKIAYYDSNPIMSDDEYDILEEELRNLDPTNKVLKLIEPTTSGFIKVNHEIPMGSLNKVQNKDQWLNWAKKFPTTTLFAITEKFDGISIAIKYINGKLVQALTRGRDGTEGENITANVIKMKNVIPQLPNNKFTGWLRGEILLLKSDHKQHFPDSKALRNIAAGTAKRFDGAGCEHLTVQYYEVFDLNKKFFSLTEQFNFLDNNGLNTTVCMSVTNQTEIPKLVKVWNSNREDIDYEIDGLVVRLNLQSEFEDVGETDNRPKGAVAYKFPPKQKITKVKSITWQVGRTGRVTPVAEIEPIDIDGVTISRVSLHTARIAIDSKAGPGATVMVSRRNDVIPYIEKVLHPAPVDDPTTHPIKELGKIRWDGEYLIIDKMEDKAVLYNSIKVWVQRLRILHWGDSFINVLMGYELVKSLPDIYRLDWDLVAQFAGDGIAKRARESLESRQTMDLATFISALNIRHCDSTAKLIVGAGVDTIDKFLDHGCAAHWLIDIDGIGKVKAAAIEKDVNWLNPIIHDLKQYITIEDKTGGLAGKSYCFTGSMKHQRKELESMVLDNGGEVKKSVTKELTYLVMADPESGTVKAQKARKLGVTCLSEDKFLEMCK